MPGHRSTSAEPSAQQRTALAQPSAQRIGGSPGEFEDARSQATAQRDTRDMLVASPQALRMRALQAMMRPTAGATAGATAQRVPDNRDQFQSFLLRMVPGQDPDVNPDFAKALSCAIILDTHHFKAGRLADPRIAKAGVPLGQPPDSYHKYLSAYVETATATPLNVVTWGAPRSVDGYALGTSVSVIFKSGHAKGSPTNKAVPWMERLKDRRDGSGTLYVMGHLLNADLGGPSLDYNYVPLTGRAGFYGANGANGVHSDIIEQIVKEKVRKVGHGVAAVRYSVAADYNRAPRGGQIGQLEAAVVRMGEIQKALPAIGKGSLMSQPAETKAKLRTLIDGNLGAALNAVSSNNYWRSGWASTLNKLQSNIALWKLEDAIVPNSLVLHLDWTQDGTPKALDYTTPIFLPTALDTPYNGALKSGGKGDDPVNHGTQFRDFLLKNLNPDEAVGGAVGAFLMDRQQYEIDQIADLMANVDMIPVLTHQLEAKDIDPLKKKRLQDQIDAVNTNASALSADIPGLAAILKSAEHRARLSKALAGKPEGAALDMAPVLGMFSLGLKPLASGTTKVEPSGQTPIGSPRQVKVTYAPNGHPEGSSAGGDNTWMSMLEQRRMPGDGSATVYVRGHMINRHIGGAGLDTNMVPLTGRGGWYGANDANAIHSGGIEETVKKLYRKLEPPGSTKAGAVTSLEYLVRAVFGDHARPETPKIGQAYGQFKVIEEQVKAGHNDEFSKKDPEAVRDLFLSYHDQQFSTALNMDPQQASRALARMLYERYAGVRKYPQGDPESTPLFDQIVADFALAANAAVLRNAYIEHIILPKMQMTGFEEARAMMSLHAFGARWRAPLSQSPGVIGEIRKQALLEPIIQASCGTDGYDALSLHEIGARMQGNWTLWQREDVMVPLGLETMAQWTQDGTLQQREVNIPNVLPSDVRAPYDRRDGS